MHLLINKINYASLFIIALLFLTFIPFSVFAQEATGSATPTTAPTITVTPTESPTPLPSSSPTPTVVTNIEISTTPISGGTTKGEVLGEATALGSTGHEYNFLKWLIVAGVGAIVLIIGLRLVRNEAQE